MHSAAPVTVAPAVIVLVPLGSPAPQVEPLSIVFHPDRYKVDLDLTAINVTNKYALYNFLSTFSRTHYVTPRAMTAKVTFNF